MSGLVNSSYLMVIFNRKKKGHLKYKSIKSYHHTNHTIMVNLNRVQSPHAEQLALPTKSKLKREELFLNTLIFFVYKSTPPVCLLSCLLACLLAYVSA